MIKIKKKKWRLQQAPPSEYQTHFMLLQRTNYLFLSVLCYFSCAALFSKLVMKNAQEWIQLFRKPFYPSSGIKTFFLFFFSIQSASKPFSTVVTCERFPEESFLRNTKLPYGCFWLLALGLSTIRLVRLKTFVTPEVHKTFKINLINTKLYKRTYLSRIANKVKQLMFCWGVKGLKSNIW